MSLSSAGLSILIILIGGANSKATELKKISGGQLEAVWLSPMSVKDRNQKKSNKVFIQVQPFQIQQYAVTVQEYKEFLNENPRWNLINADESFVDKNYLNQLSHSDEKSPITNISWFAARAYCKSKGLRLPTLNEWEFVAAASESAKDANRNEKFLRRILDWYGEPQSDKLKHVGSIYKNIYGVYDMHGLIWEWVEDFNTTFVTGESREDSSFNKDMFCGGGALASNDKENYAAFMRFAFRSSLKGTSSTWNLGFRCATEEKK